MSHIVRSAIDSYKWTFLWVLASQSPSSRIVIVACQTMQLESIVTKTLIATAGAGGGGACQAALSAILDIASLRNAIVNDCILHSSAWKACWGDQLDTFIGLFEVCRGLWALWTMAPFLHFGRSRLSLRSFGEDLVALLNSYADLRGVLSTPVDLLHKFYLDVLNQLAHLGRLRVWPDRDF